MPDVNRQITLAARPVGYPNESDFRLLEVPMPVPGPGEALVKIVYLSLDPYMRGVMNETSPYRTPLKLGDLMLGGAVGKVTVSNQADLRKGDIVEGMFGWQGYTVTDGKGLRRIDPNAAPISTALGVLGMPGLTAYFGLLEVGRPKAGEVVLVSGGAGAVGSVVGQIAKMQGCRVIGIAGADPKINIMMRDYGYDAVFNYKSVENYYAVLSEMCPDGVDVYFDNVGGAITDAALRVLNRGARIAICGQIAMYNLEQHEAGPRPFPTLLFKQARAEGFLVTEFSDRYPQALAQLTQWLQEKKLKYREDIVEGIENAPAAFIAMLHGRNIGKQLVKLAVP